MSTLNGKAINETFDGLLKTSDENPLPATGRVRIQDGLGNDTALSIGRAGEGIAIDGPIEGITVGGTVSDKTFSVSSLSDFISNEIPFYVSFLIDGETCESIHIKFFNEASRLPVYTTTIANPTNNTVYSIGQSYPFKTSNYTVFFEAKFADNTTMYDVAKVAILIEDQYTYTESLVSHGIVTNPDISNAKRIWDANLADQQLKYPQAPRRKFPYNSFYEIYTIVDSSDDLIPYFMERQSFVPDMNYIEKPIDASGVINYASDNYSVSVGPSSIYIENALFRYDAINNRYEKVEVIFSEKWHTINREERVFTYEVQGRTPYFYKNYIGAVVDSTGWSSVSTPARTVDFTNANQDIPDRCSVEAVSFNSVNSSSGVNFTVDWEVQNQVGGNVSIYDVATMQVLATVPAYQSSSYQSINIGFSDLSEGQELQGWVDMELASTPSFIYTKTITLDRPTVSFTQNGSPTPNGISATLSLTKWLTVYSNLSNVNSYLDKIKIIRNSDGAEFYPTINIDGRPYSNLRKYVFNYLQQSLYEDSITVQNIDIDLSWVASITGSVTVQLIGRDYWDVINYYKVGPNEERVLASFNYTV